MHQGNWHKMDDTGRHTCTKESLNTKGHRNTHIHKHICKGRRGYWGTHSHAYTKGLGHTSGSFSLVNGFGKPASLGVVSPTNWFYKSTHFTLGVILQNHPLRMVSLYRLVLQNHPRHFMGGYMELP